MARPVGADAERTRTRIREAAAELFAARGPDAVSIRDVVGAAGVSVAMVSHHFGSKDDLYTAVVEGMYEELAALASVLFAIPPGPDLLPRAVRETFRFARAHQPALRLTLRDVLQHGELPPSRRDRVLLPFLDAITALFPRHAPEELRLRAQSLVFLIVRYALATPAEIGRIAGFLYATPEQALALAEAHLISLAHLLLKEEDACATLPSPRSPTASGSAPSSPTSSAASSTSTGSSSSPRSRRPKKSR